MKFLLPFEYMGLMMTSFCTFESVHGRNVAPHQKGAGGALSPHGAEGSGRGGGGVSGRSEYRSLLISVSSSSVSGSS